ncbi:type IV secretory system conjugative DNA transfer family protein [Photorhabdus hainanensis]|uniref:type IV secretory system conjugative DNA transfer family protein n=1 Tax=Photorhabdus hainanensis TaxID=1004166 RepID=UPI001BD6CA5B|nr:type IV secretory system conjugative DNA transfer family protein [Photorhabdus hainanensis]MBS9434865.1 conjugal transfer protein [Photorhabdus hainanensis]
MKKLFILLPIFFSSLAVAQSHEQDLAPKAKPISDYLSPNSSSDVDDVSYSMLKEVAETIGFRGGKEERSVELLNVLEKYASTLDMMYRFEPLISPESYAPPVIVEVKDVAHITDEQMRTGVKVYEILKPARFVSNPPSWRQYLKVGLYSSAIEPPERAVLPKNSAERDIWKKGIIAGWVKGRENADDVLRANFNRLTRDYNGMLRYSTLLQLNMIKPPIISQRTLTVTGSDERMILGDEVKKIESKATLELNKSKWKPTIK